MNSRLKVFRSFNRFFLSRKGLIFAFFGLIALFNTIYLIRFISHIDRSGLVDLNCYWNSGLYVRLHMNPYTAYLEKISLPAEISLIDGSIVDIDEAEAILLHPGLPGNTAPFVLFFSLFSFLPLRTAAVIWALANILYSVMIPILVLKIFEEFGLAIRKGFYPIAIYVFFALNMTFRGIIGNGQTTSFILVFMLLSILGERRGHYGLAGTCLGIALSKYNVAIPVFIYFLYQREWRVLILSVVFQLIGLAVFAAITQVSPIEILQNYLAIARFHATSGYVHGVNVSAYLPKSLLFVVGSLVLVTFVFAGVGRFITQRRAGSDEAARSIAMTFLALSFLWTLLGFYHLGYDTVLAIFPLLRIMVTIDRYDTSHCEQSQTFIVLLMTGIALIGLTIPGTVFRLILPGQNLDSFAMTSAFILLTIVIMIVDAFPMSERRTEGSPRQTAWQ